ncbi:hypothetical protein [Nostoc sp. FACHB-190]|uniref:hypothetical protein n=1 Tax=Nostoc sp. FACHB-190 TaxID=2692838 RepID=UPI0016885D03|nr:hypothetical protein [Nostoc sp. FACHB-190]MBD2300329.1 hypothetical protein [Nostoc sp. FACHB-190]
MKYKFLFPSLFIFSLSTLPAQACPSGNPETTDYIRRDNNRCEGIQTRDVTSGIRLISIATRGITNYPDLITLQIPRVGNSNTTPEVKLQSLSKNYLLDNLSLKRTQGLFTFPLKPDVLNAAAVPPNSLRALASVNSIYLPVTIGKPSGRYEFVFYTSRRATFPTFAILRKGKVIYKSPRNNYQNGEVVFTWHALKAPAGRYQIHVIAQQERIGRKDEPFERRYDFDHNPNWLK